MALLCARRVNAHEGPPFPIVMDEKSGDFSISVWADPDIGEGTFYIIVEMRDGANPPDNLEVSMWTEPVSGRLDRAEYTTERRELRQVQYAAYPPFDQRDMWNVGFEISGDGLKSASVRAQVESTPPGFGAWDLAVYLFPFLLVGGLWLAALVRRRKQIRAVEYSARDAATSVT